MKWYHTYILDPGLDQKEENIFQNLYWPGIREFSQREVMGCEKRQHTKQSTKNGKLPANISDKTPWNKLCVDIRGPYKILRKWKEPLI